METDWAPVWMAGMQFAFNAVPIGVGLYILNRQEKSLSDKLVIQDKSLSDKLATQDQYQKEDLKTLKEVQKEDLKALKEVLATQDQIWNLRFSNFIDALERRRDNKD